jgi:hypothetical protein
MECQYLPTCGFFKKYKESKNLACIGFINRYCKGSEMEQCKRLEYRKLHNTAPPEDMMPSGQMITA